MAAHARRLGTPALRRERGEARLGRVSASRCSRVYVRGRRTPRLGWQTSRRTAPASNHGLVLGRSLACATSKSAWVIRRGSPVASESSSARSAASSVRSRRSAPEIRQYDVQSAMSTSPTGRSRRWDRRIATRRRDRAAGRAEPDRTGRAAGMPDQRPTAGSSRRVRTRPRTRRACCRAPTGAARRRCGRPTAPGCCVHAERIDLVEEQDAGVLRRAVSKSSCSFFSDCPSHMSSTS